MQVSIFKWEKNNKKELYKENYKYKIKEFFI